MIDAGFVAPTTETVALRMYDVATAVQESKPLKGCKRHSENGALGG